MDVEKALIGAGLRTGSLAKGDSRLGKLIGLELKMVGKILAEHLRPHEEPILFVPLEVQVAGKWEKGGVLGLEDRALVAWWTGTLRPKAYLKTLVHAAVEKIETVKSEPGTWRVPEKTWLEVRGDQSLLLRTMRIKDQTDLRFLVICALTGAISPAEAPASNEG